MEGINEYSKTRISENSTEPNEPKLNTRQKQLVKKESKSQRKLNRTQQLQKEQEEIEKSENRTGLRTASDVIKRIKWDSVFNVEDFHVGYLDRFLGLLEEPFDTFNWDDDLASLDPENDELAIPRHRIQYIKFKKTIVWDKRTRVDNVFGSCGGKKFEEILEQELT